VTNAKDEEPVDFGRPPLAMSDGRQVYRKVGNCWYPVDLEDVRSTDFIAILGDPQFNPDDVRLWIVKGHPFVLPDGRWSVGVRTVELDSTLEQQP